MHHIRLFGKKQGSLARRPFTQQKTPPGTRREAFSAHERRLLFMLQNPCRGRRLCRPDQCCKFAVDFRKGLHFAHLIVGADAHIGPLGSCEFAEDFRKKRPVLRADRVVRPYKRTERIADRIRRRRLCIRFSPPAEARAPSTPCAVCSGPAQAMRARRASPAP